MIIQEERRLERLSKDEEGVYRMLNTFKDVASSLDVI
jgi:hypothetical protein